MKIVLVGPTYPFRGGISHYNTVLFQALEPGHDVTMVSLKRQYPSLLFPGKTQEDASGTPIEVENERLLDPLSPWTWYRAFSRIRSLRPDLVAIQWWHPFFSMAFGTLARLLERRAGIPTAFICHNVHPHEQTFIDGVLSRYALRKASRFIVHSETDRGHLERFCPGRLVRVTPHPTYSMFRGGETIPREEARARLGLDDRPVILYFGNIRKYKGLPHLIEAMPRVRRSIDARLLAVGEFYYDSAPVKKRVQDLGLDESVRFVDEYVPNEDVKLYFSACNVVILPYTSASQSGIAQIAFAFERPVVATDVGGLPEVIEDGRTGLICPPNDPPALAETIVRYFAGGHEAPFAENIRRDADRFSWDRLVESLASLVAPTDPGAAAAGHDPAESTTKAEPAASDDRATSLRTPVSG